MVRRNPQRYSLPPELEQEVLELLETYGEFADPRAVADCIGAEPRALVYFLRTTPAKEAAAKAPPKDLVRKHLVASSPAPSTPQEVLQEAPSGFQIINDAVPEDLASAFDQVTKRKR